MTRLTIFHYFFPSLSPQAVYYKHADALFFPTSAFVLAQTLVLFPLQMLETIIFGKEKIQLNGNSPVRLYFICSVFFLSCF